MEVINAISLSKGAMTCEQAALPPPPSLSPQELPVRPDQLIFMLHGSGGSTFDNHAKKKFILWLRHVSYLVDRIWRLVLPGVGVLV